MTTEPTGTDAAPPEAQTPPAGATLPNREQRRAAKAEARKAAKQPPEEQRQPLAKVYIVFSHVDEAGDLRNSWKIVSGLTTLRTAVEVMNAVALIEKDGKFKNVTIVNWMSLED